MYFLNWHWKCQFSDKIEDFRAGIGSGSSRKLAVKSKILELDSMQKLSKKGEKNGR